MFNDVYIMSNCIKIGDHYTILSDVDPYHLDTDPDRPRERKWIQIRHRSRKCIIAKWPIYLSMRLIHRDISFLMGRRRVMNLNFSGCGEGNKMKFTKGK